jgi:nucleoid DNA-binding protein
METTYRGLLMSKAELVAAVQKSLGKETSSAQADRTVDAVINGIKTGVKKTKSVQLIQNCHTESTQGRQSKDRGKDQDQGQQDGQIRAGSSIQENLVIG